MSKEYWNEVLKTAIVKLSELHARRDALDAEREEVNLEAVQLEELIKNLTPLATETPLEKIKPFLIKNVTELSLADACREVLKKSNIHMTPIEIRDTLAASKYDLSQYSNPLASIHSVLKRMVESGEVERLPHEQRGTMYRWKAPIQSGITMKSKPAYGPPDMTEILKAANAAGIQGMKTAAEQMAEASSKMAGIGAAKQFSDDAAKMIGNSALKAAADSMSKTTSDALREMAGNSGESLADTFRAMTGTPKKKK